MPIPGIQTNKALARRAYEDARQYAYRVVRHCILAFLLLPGQKLNEADLAQSLSISRTPVHDTIFKLSREHLTDIYPNRGAFVSKLCCRSIDQAVWTHIQMGKSILHNIYLYNVPKSKLASLYYQLDQMEDLIQRNSLSEFTPLLMEFYKSLYMMAGNLELVWKSLQNVDLDLRRFLYLASANPTVAEGIIRELNDLTDALIVRNYDRACEIYEKHFSRMLLMLAPLRQRNPDYFITDRDSQF